MGIQMVITYNVLVQLNFLCPFFVIFYAEIWMPAFDILIWINLTFLYDDPDSRVGIIADPHSPGSYSKVYSVVLYIRIVSMRIRIQHFLTMWIQIQIQGFDEKKFEIYS